MKEVDTDQDGQISLEEFMTSMSAFLKKSMVKEQKQQPEEEQEKQAEEGQA